MTVEIPDLPEATDLDSAFLTGYQGSTDERFPATLFWPATTQTVTLLTGNDFGQAQTTTFAPASASDANVFAQTGKVTYSVSADQSGAGHLGGQLGYVDVLDGQDSALILGIEGKVDNGTGTMDFGVPMLSQVSKNDGTITTLLMQRGQLVENDGTIGTYIGNSSVVDANAGAITTYLAHSFSVTSNAGTIGTLVGSHFPDLSGISNITLKYSLLNQDIDARLDTVGQMVSASRQEVGSSHPGLAGSRYYHPYGTTAMSSSAIVANFMYAILFECPQRTTFTRIGVEVTASAAGNARLGIYKFVDGFPTDLVVAAAEIDVSTTGIKEPTISATLEAGFYCLTIFSDVTPTIDWVTVHGVAGKFGSTVNGILDSYGVRSLAYTTLPATFGAFSLASLSGTQVPDIWLREV